MTAMFFAGFAACALLVAVSALIGWGWHQSRVRKQADGLDAETRAAVITVAAYAVTHARQVAP